MYYAISAVVKKQKPDLVKRVLKIVNQEISKLNKEKNQLQAKFSKQFATPIRPTNKKLNRTSFTASETFPKIPFYIPGSNEIGEMILSHLRDINGVAYIRFASVYRQFDGINDFMKTLESLKPIKKEQLASVL